MPTAEVESTAEILSCASFDGQGRLLDWDAGFTSEFATVSEHPLPGAPFGEILRLAFDRDHVIRVALLEGGSGEIERRIKRWQEEGGPAESFEYRKGSRVLWVKESRTVSGGILRVVTNVTAESRTQLRVSEGRFRSMANFLPVPDEDAEWQTWSEQMGRV